MVKRRYPIHRKPPVQHIVKSHTRDGHSVDGYSRGSGQKRTIPISRSKVNAEAFIVTLKYKDGSSEKINVIAPKGSYQKAIGEALEEKTHKGYPVEVNILDPSLGEVIGFIRKGIGTGLKYVKSGVKKASPHVKSGLKMGARGLGKGVKVAGKRVGRSIASSLTDRDARRLVNHAYSDDPSKSAVARAKLKEKYPEVYDNCDFSVRVKPLEKKRETKKKSKSYFQRLKEIQGKKRKTRRRK